MACGTPTIVCRNSALPEVLGDAALYVDENDPADMAAAITRLYDADTRRDFVERGLQQARRFSFGRMAQELANAFAETHDRLQAANVALPNPAWADLREYQRRCQAASATGGDMDRTAVSFDSPPPAVELERARRTIADMRRSPFWRAREMSVRLLRKSGLRRRD
jgi:hypothetical protein